MSKLKNLLLIAILLFSFNAQSQCDYSLDNYQHINCNGDNTGAIDISIPSTNSTFWWVGPAGFTSNSFNLSSLFAGDYTLHIMNNLVPGDTSSTLICYFVDTITIEQALPITASFTLSTMCNANDSADVFTTIWGGTPPYTTLWSTGDTARNTDSLAPSILLPYTLTIVDKNNCPGYEELFINSVTAMNPFMSVVNVICKDDNSGQARVFVTEGTAPFSFVWENEMSPMVHDSFTVINNLFPGVYAVEITDDMGCVTSDSIEVKSNPAICITVYKVFSPNDDDIHEFWEIENINLYPEALVLVYDRNGRQVFRRRNYVNAEEHAFSGKDQEGRTLPSGTYYYIIDLGNDDAVFKGALTIVR